MIFPLGRLVCTPGAQAAINATDPAVIMDILNRYQSGDWGDMDDENDKALNTAAVNTGGRILAAYFLPDGTRLWIITEADRSSTTILLPEDY